MFSLVLIFNLLPNRKVVEKIFLTWLYQVGVVGNKLVTMTVRGPSHLSPWGHWYGVSESN